jgi:hypothetical protein
MRENELLVESVGLGQGAVEFGGVDQSILTH